MPDPISRNINDHVWMEARNKSKGACSSWQWSCASYTLYFPTSISLSSSVQGVLSRRLQLYALDFASTQSLILSSLSITVYRREKEGRRESERRSKDARMIVKISASWRIAYPLDQFKSIFHLFPIRTSLHRTSYCCFSTTRIKRFPWFSIRREKRNREH